MVWLRAVAIALLAAPLCTQVADQPAERRSVRLPLGQVTLMHHPNGERARFEIELWVMVPDADALSLCGGYLTSLHRRFAPHDVRITAVVPPALVDKVVASRPAFHVAVMSGNGSELRNLPFFWQCVLTKPDCHYRMLMLDGASAILARGVEARALRDAGEAHEVVPSGPNMEPHLFRALETVTIGDVDVKTAADLVQQLPGSGRAHALAVLTAWWTNGDHAAACAAVDEGLRALRGDALPLCWFADLVLRGDATDPSIAQRLATELGPAVAEIGHDPFAQQVQLRALFRSRNDRFATLLLERHVAATADRPQLQLALAEILMDAAEPRAQRALAERMIDAALQANGAAPKPALVAMTRHKLLARCGDSDAAATLWQQLRDAGGLEHFALPNEAWHAAADIDVMGRFAPWGRAAAVAGLSAGGDTLWAADRDTYALALFCAGDLAAAVEQQTLVVRDPRQRDGYSKRLRRYQDALARRNQAVGGAGKAAEAGKAGQAVEAVEAR